MVWEKYFDALIIVCLQETEAMSNLLGLIENLLKGIPGIHRLGSRAQKGDQEAQSGNWGCFSSLPFCLQDDLDGL